MAMLHFDQDRLKQLIAHAKSAPKHKALWQQPETNQPGLWLVGDHGVYLMSNGNPGFMEGNGNFVAYAKGCDPNVDEDFYDRKEEVFGGDDGVEFLEISGIEEAIMRGEVIIEIDDNSVRVFSMASD